MNSTNNGSDGLDEDRKRALRQSAAGLLWTKQFYQYIVKGLAGRRPIRTRAAGESLVGKKS